MNLIEQHEAAIESLCRQYAVRSLYAFGSIVNGELSETSDIDLLVEFDWKRRCNFSDCYWELKTGLEALLGRPVDLVCDSAIRNPIFRREVDSHKEAIYAA